MKTRTPGTNPDYPGNSAIILAGGGARRMDGTDKGLLSYRGTTFIENKVLLLQALFGEVLIVAGEKHPYGELGIRVVTDDVPGGGVLPALRTGLKAARFNTAFVTTSDTPFVRQRLVSLLIEAAETEVDAAAGINAVVPEWKGHIEPLCAVYTKICMPAIDRAIAGGEKKIRSFFGEVHVKYLPEAEIGKIDPRGESFININTPEDFEKYVT